MAGLYEIGVRKIKSNFCISCIDRPKIHSSLQYSLGKLDRIPALGLFIACNASTFYNIK